MGLAETGTSWDERKVNGNFISALHCSPVLLLLSPVYSTGHLALPGAAPDAGSVFSRN